MVRIAIVIPYASMANLAWDVFQEHTEQMRLQALDATEYSLDILVASTTQELLPQWPDCDAMIARGATYLDLCRRSLSIPVRPAAGRQWRAGWISCGRSTALFRPPSWEPRT